MKKLVLLATVSASALGLSAVSSFADYTLNILHINDWHSRIESISKYDSTCSAEDEGEGKCFGGAARLKTAIDQRRSALEGSNMLLLNAGDNFQGSLFYSTYKGAVEAEFLNLMKFDAMAVGNHEFDDGEDGLATFLDKVTFPVLSANVLASESSKLGDRVKPYVILEVGGEKIGIVGAVANDTDELSSPGENVLIAEDVAGITAAVEEIAGKGVNKIVALTHVGYPRDLMAIAKIPGVDVVVGGHSHTLLSNTDDHAAGPYPTWVDNPDGHKVPVVQARSYSKYLGEIAVTFGDDGVVTAAKGDPILLDASFKPDQAVAARVAELAAPIEELKAKVVAESSAPIDGDRNSCRARECEMGNLVADAMLERVKDQGVSVAVQNGGGLRASIDGGEVTMGEVLTVLPFQNTLATFQLSGKDIVASLEGGVSQVEEGKGRFPQVAGLRYSFDPGVAPNEGRVKSVEVKEGDDWAPIDPDKVYGVVTNDFMRNGGDGYALFRDNGANAYDYGPGLEQVVAEYLAGHNPYTPYLDGRITDLVAAAAMKKDEMAKEEMAKTDMAKKDEMAKADMAKKDDMAKSEDTAMKKEMPEKAMAKEEMKDGMAKGEMKTAAMSEDKMAKPAMHKVRSGDTYWTIAKKYYGKPTMWEKIRDANPKYRNSRHLRVGAQLTIPPAN